MLSGTAHAGDADVVAEDGQWHEKADQVRVYSGAKSTTVDTVPAGTICAVTGLTQTFPGEGLGMERDAGSPVLQPVLTYTLEPGSAIFTNVSSPYANWRTRIRCCTSSGSLA